MDGIALVLIGCLLALSAIPWGGFGKRIRRRAGAGELRPWRIIILTISTILVLAGAAKLLIYFQAP